MTPTKIDLQKPPKFLEILGSKGFQFDDELNTSLMTFVISKDLTHSNGTIVQGGFITAMLDAAMAHLIILKSNGEVNPLSLNINVNFIAPGSPGEFVAKGEIRKWVKALPLHQARFTRERLLLLQQQLLIK